MRQSTIFLSLAALLWQGGAPAAAAQARAPDGRLSARSEARFTLSLDPRSAPRLPASADAVAFDRGSRLHVLDRQNRLIYVFRADGRLEGRLDLHSIAETPLQMTVTRENRIVVSDAGRKVFISIDPANPGRATVHPFTGMALSGPLAAHPDGGVVTQARPLSEADLAAGRLAPARLVWFPLDGRSEVVLHTFSRTPRPRGTGGALTPAPLAAPLPGRRAVVALPESYRLRVVGAGAPRDIVRRVEARPVAERDRRWAEQQAACTQVFTVGAPVGIGASLSGASAPAHALPDRMPVLRGLGVAPDGRIWVERTPADPGRTGAVDVFHPDGRLLGSVEGVGVPRAWAPDGETVAYVTRDAQCRVTVEVRRVRVAQGA